ncbi:MAG: hypothetical protein JSW65_04565 [Candidatus Bipolaricaulota bacterium]|nr:MAG: hypothetical protein JSW65_04565 [Candidatus Bipolaricaulota bacterium]
MRRMLASLLMVVFLFAATATLAVYGGPGPAPNSGDGIPDGSGFVVPPGPAGDGDPMGPNPAAGDGIPDGSDLPAPNGPA